MKKFWKLGVLFLSVLLLAMIVAACGGEGQHEEVGQQQEEKTEIKKIVVGTEPAFAPFEFKDENGEFVGFDIDLMKAIAKAQGLEVEFKGMGFDGLIPALQVGQIDAAISGMTINEDRKEKVNFSIPYYESGLMLAVRADNEDIKGPEDLAGKVIAVQIGTTGAAKSEEFVEAYGAEVKTFNSSDLIFMELINGGADVIINDLPAIQYFIKQKGEGKIKLVGDLLTGEYYGIAIAKENIELLDLINKGLMQLKENGKYADIYRKWFAEDPAEYLPGEPK